MALAARPVSIAPAPPSASSGRIASGSRGVASAQSGPVDGIGTQSDIQNTTQFNYEGYADLSRRQKRPDFQPLTNTASKFETLTSTFISMLDSKKDKQAVVDQEGETQSFSPSFVAHAIEAYEGTALVIHGNPQAMGQSISLSL